MIGLSDLVEAPGFRSSKINALAKLSGRIKHKTKRMENPSMKFSVYHNSFLSRTIGNNASYFYLRIFQESIKYLKKLHLSIGKDTKIAMPAQVKQLPRLNHKI
jgi:hypothetical protein